MSDDDTGHPDTHMSDPFELLGNRTRLEIIRALIQANSSPLSFRTLFERTSCPDSGNFNYHLQQLRGLFVQKTNGYELTLAGKRVGGAILANSFAPEQTVEPIDLDWRCLLCDGTKQASYRDGRAHIRCVDCDGGATFPFPAGTIEQFEREALGRAFARWLRVLIQRVTMGFCPVCAGRVTAQIERLPGGTPADPKPSRVLFDCQRCVSGLYLSGSSVVTYHPHVEQFFFAHGLELHEAHAEHAWATLDRFNSTIVSKAPPTIRFEFEYDGDRIEPVLHANGDVRFE
ncbi:DUF7351 domain-containing protein [Halocatena halophila]|uniref:DUF7351 domain-containing protein n=1 Tax=Halocatena halophila TaxID=2814576 RepID=UPI002ED44EDA